MANDPIRAMRVTPAGAITDVTLPPDVHGQLGAMCQQIECSLVEPVGLGAGLTMWCDEEGLVTRTPVANLCATGIAARHGLCAQPYVGTVLFTGGSTAGGELRGLSDAQAADLRRECEHVVRFVVAQRIARPERGALAEVQLVQDEYSFELGISAR